MLGVVTRDELYTVRDVEEGHDIYLSSAGGLE
jgi:hypothetical protein